VAKWRKCTLAQNGEPEFINLANVAKLVPHAKGCRIIMVGLKHDTIVSQSPVEVLGGEEIS